MGHSKFKLLKIKSFQSSKALFLLYYTSHETADTLTMEEEPRVPGKRKAGNKIPSLAPRCMNLFPLSAGLCVSWSRKLLPQGPVLLSHALLDKKVPRRCILSCSSTSLSTFPLSLHLSCSPLTFIPITRVLDKLSFQE